MHKLLEQTGVVSVFTSPGADAAIWVARILVDAGFPIFEVTFRNEHGASSIAAVGREVSGAIPGAGTILTADQADEACDAGAQFLVSPGFSPEVSRRAVERGVPYYPGVVTATEIQSALSAGFRVLKFFPAEASGGVKTLKALAPVFPGITFMPTGGVGTSNLAEYLGLPCVVACGGSFLVPGKAIQSRDEKGIRTVAEETKAVIERVRASGKR